MRLTPAHLIRHRPHLPAVEPDAHAQPQQLVLPRVEPRFVVSVCVSRPVADARANLAHHLLRLVVRHVVVDPDGHLHDDRVLVAFNHDVHGHVTSVRLDERVPKRRQRSVR